MMKTTPRKILFTLILLVAFSFANAQTNVSGGIFANTTWTLANSPYIVVDTVVVFPGVTLTIEPGVVVKFDNDKRIEIRQAKLIATGTGTDSITFTSNAASPTPGIYPGIYLNGGALTSRFDYCNLNYATLAINVVVSDSVIVNHSNFSQNVTGLQFVNAASGVALLDNSIFNANANVGADFESLHAAKINYCTFTNNGSDGLILKDLNGTPMFPLVTYCDFSFNNNGLLFGIYKGITEHCNFLHNTAGIKEDASNLSQSQFSPYNNKMSNCFFDSNQTGLSTLYRTILDSSIVLHSQTGYNGGVGRITNCTIDSNSVAGMSCYTDTIVNCSIKYNGTGIACFATKIIGCDIEYNTGDNINCDASGGSNIINGNTIRYGSIGINNSVAGTLVITNNIIANNNLGINLISSNTTINCNSICNNSTYDLKYLDSSNLDASHNYWCIPDSASTEAAIYDGYDNINYGLVSFMPVDSLCSPIFTSVNEIARENLSFSIFPNPATSELTVGSSEFGDKKIERLEIYNAFGERVFSQRPTGGSQELIINVSGFASGIYIIQMTVGDKIGRQKFIRQ